MDLHAARRERDQALRHYASCKAMLAREHGVPPGVETQHLRQRLIDSLPLQRAAARRRPTVRVLTFENLSADPGQDRYLRGLKEAIVIELSSLRELDVIHHEGSEPGEPADFVLRGSFLADEGAVQIILRLVHAASGL
ncbi:hypothetical protein LV780_18235 [Cereibacter azotoformans]|uniref:Uncharacterized protein n=1 Tax=Cereibacter azotoformans TaxID=43057 RepID=A0A2T5JLG9_9RHOB|nr:hypothetical protein [Cereibacter azotoformans]AXQ95487.1 hypothetical protein D0Z66_17035 [Cereibacter sphaeroides]PTR07656.1 hypothetical protein C8J28_1399 [Cereibacter azotoformans]UIJ32269.1 hypothetical protein LV780_18235 [Cereibacter azotoformans]